MFDPSRHSDSVFVAGGIGITPFMSMVEFAAVTNCERPITLLYGVQTQDDIPFLSQLREFQTSNPKLRITLAVGNGPIDKLADFSTVRGRITPELLLKTVGKADKTVFICGPPPFMHGLVLALQNAGVPQERIITEAFNQGSHRQTGKVVSWPRNVYVMGTLGLGLGTLAIMTTDIMKTLPSTPLMENDEVSAPLRSTGQREKDLDSLINGLPALANTQPNSPGVTNAQNQTPAPTSSQIMTTPTTTPNPTTTARTPVTPTPAPAPAPAPVPTPAPQPKCTTSQSGVTTCV